MELQISQVLAPQYRRRIFYGEKKRAIGEILRKLCEWNGGKHGRSEVLLCEHENGVSKITGRDFLGAFPFKNQKS